jgi:hypothetical protein
MSTEPKKDITQIPKPEVGDVSHLAVKSFLASIPGLGAAASEIFNYVIAPPLVKRQQEWMEAVAIRLVELEKTVEGFKIENLRSNDNFLSTVIYATALAVRNHQEEKMCALQNAVVNVALNIPIEQDLEHMFLNFIDELTPSHLKVLKYFENPIEWLKIKGITLPNYTAGGASTIFDTAFPEIAMIPDFAKQIVNDLSSRGLADDWESMHIMVSYSAMVAPRITPWGKKFLNFISSPTELA